MEEKSYEALCEEQRRPYLQWLKKQEQELHTECDMEKGKQVVRLPFLSCEESWTECLEKEASQVSVKRQLPILQARQMIQTVSYGFL